MTLPVLLVIWVLVLALAFAANFNLMPSTIGLAAVLILGLVAIWLVTGAARRAARTQQR